MLYHRGERQIASAILFPEGERSEPQLQQHIYITPPIPISDLYICGNGVDLRYADRKRPLPFQYEDACFAQVTANAKPDNFFLGPHLIDSVFSVGFGGISRPDAIRFKVGGKDWTIAELFEFKSGKRIKSVGKKLEGFARLLRRMRSNEEYLSRLLKAALPGDEVIPDQIGVPEDKDIEITFVSPRLQNDTIFFQDAPRFKVSHLQVPSS